MSNFDTVDVRDDSIIIKDTPNWMVITDEVEIDLYSGESQIMGKVDGISQWYLWVPNDLAAQVERAAKNHDRITTTVNDQ